ncbi:hypothetical protein BDK51DRAFT_40514 [Blyttiomyces helicus]|uniref:HCP-like protein n=1 Tax=Blyttiomyces helicus TaxID=388810 RepID=A0A4P9W9W8_9FUNG|nr:hypothetical protein BDK51DRAFT_40514 [Blyttiomyces helicus]|eukprot:RKO88992.1 hypothetical protein BDK51DRAFT_40514 [Blyttiomyces helicus]
MNKLSIITDSPSPRSPRPPTTSPRAASPSPAHLSSKARYLNNPSRSPVGRRRSRSASSFTSPTFSPPPFVRDDGVTGRASKNLASVAPEVPIGVDISCYEASVGDVSDTEGEETHVARGEEVAAPAADWDHEVQNGAEVPVDDTVRPDFPAFDHSPSAANANPTPTLDLALHPPTSRASQIALITRISSLKRLASLPNATPQDRFDHAKYILDHAAKLEFDRYRYVSSAVKTLQALASGSGPDCAGGFPKAQLVMANMLITGPPCEVGVVDADFPDWKGAFKLYLRAADGGESDGAYHAALLIEQGRVITSERNAAKNLLRIAARSNHPGALYRLARSRINSTIQAQQTWALQCLRQSAVHATRRYPDGLHDLALLYRTGTPCHTISRSPQTALRLLSAAADFGHAPSQHALSKAYAQGDPTLAIPTPSPTLSVHFASLAARSHPPAMLALAQMYRTGVVDVPAAASPAVIVLQRDDAEAYLLARKAADLGLAQAQCMVGRCVEEGSGIRCADPIREAKMWYSRAAAQGDREAVELLARLEVARI